MFLCRVTVVYTRSSAKNCVVTSCALDCISPLISSCTTLGFLTTHLKSSDADPVAQGARFCVGFGGAEYDVGVGKEKIEVGFVGGRNIGDEECDSVVYVAEVVDLWGSGGR